MIDPIKRDAELREAIELFYFSYRAFTSNPDRILDQRGLGRVHHRILYFVGRNRDVSVKALLEILGVSKQALNAPLRQLIEMRLVSVQAAAHDRRYKCLQLSSEGARLEAQLTGTQMKHLAASFAACGREAEVAWKSVMRSVAMK